MYSSKITDSIRQASKSDLTDIIQESSQDFKTLLVKTAQETRLAEYGPDVYIRGLIEFTNHCKNGCYYCGIRRENLDLSRYRLNKDAILSCCQDGYELGIRSFVLQGGEDPYYTPAKMCSIIEAIKTHYPDCALTLSFGEQDESAYRQYFSAGADRYLLRHESANSDHYQKLHPSGMTFENRKRCLYQLKEIGFAVGAGFMVGSPYQIPANLAEDLLFLKELEPHMVGIGPFIPHQATPFSNKAPGGMEQTVLMVALVRILLPKSLLPATTALGSIADDGREKALLAGANVVMPNLSPLDYRKDYSLYDNKVYSGTEAAESLKLIMDRITSIGLTPQLTRGDPK